MSNGNSPQVLGPVTTFIIAVLMEIFRRVSVEFMRRLSQYAAERSARRKIADLNKGWD